MLRMHKYLCHIDLDVEIEMSLGEKGTFLRLVGRYLTLLSGTVRQVGG